MSTTVISTDLINTAFNNLVGFEIDTGDPLNVIVREGVMVLGDLTGLSGGASNGTDRINILVQGTVVGGSGDAIRVLDDNATVTIADTGSAITFNTASSISSAAGVIVGPGGTVINHGTIEGGRGIAFGASNGTVSTEDRVVVNTGTITSTGSETTNVFQTNATITMTVGTDPGTLFRVNNSGLIQATEDYFGRAISGFDIAPVAILTARSDSEMELTNSGQIIGAIISSTREDDITNSGEIIGDILTFEGDDTLINSGTVVGVVDLGVSNDRVVNTNLMIGDLRMGSGNDTVINTGEIQGDIDLGSSNDIYRAAPDGFVVGSVNGGLGNDTMVGGREDDVLLGGGDADAVSGGKGDDALSGEAGNDSLFGNDGADTLLGGDGEDVLQGGAGFDDLDGGDGTDTLNGGDGDDVLNGGDSDDRDVLQGAAGDDQLAGGRGNDVLRGGAGDDTLIGGSGRDDQFGGTGADIFVFRDMDDVTTGLLRDRVQDFEDGVDLIDLSDFGTLAFGGGSAVGGGTASFWAVGFQAGASTLVRMDLDGDGKVDGEILIRNLDVGDFDTSDVILA